jgi:hypothetical protein
VWALEFAYSPYWFTIALPGGDEARAKEVFLETGKLIIERLEAIIG